MSSRNTHRSSSSFSQQHQAVPSSRMTSQRVPAGLTNIGGMGTGTAAPSSSRIGSHRSNAPTGSRLPTARVPTAAAQPPIGSRRQSQQQMLDVPLVGNTHGHGGGSRSGMNMNGMYPSAAPAPSRSASVHHSNSMMMNAPGPSRHQSMSMAPNGALMRPSMAARLRNEAAMGGGMAGAMVSYAPQNDMARQQSVSSSRGMSSRGMETRDGRGGMMAPSRSDGRPPRGARSATYEYSYMKVTYHG
ncbi:hypothetical protein N0V83_006375 [Neocucurbitaria cava]|uniref:Uncharacterized protein n=1 Tax=Neocucurbitaria cava TaxID=798079 RepID=A0A9W8Y559_9PLEO|nr:hypothetical protein N0V83_006375 [Neocucurbitaria cava]